MIGWKRRFVVVKLWHKGKEKGEEKRLDFSSKIKHFLLVGVARFELAAS